MPEIKKWTPEGIEEKGEKNLGLAVRGFDVNRPQKRQIIGEGASSYRVTEEGLSLGAEQFGNAPFKVNMAGDMTVQRITMDNFVVCDHSSIVYTGTWTLQSAAALMAGKRKTSSTVGDYFVVSFTGTAIGVVFEKAGNVGKVKIYIDDVLQDTVDLYSSTLLVRSIVWKTTGLQNKAHTLKGEVETKNALATANNVGFQGYSLFPNEGIKIESLSCDLYAYGVSLTTNAQGYATASITAPSGYVVYHIVGVRPSIARMSHILGDTTSQWDVTNPAGTTFRYTYDGTGTAPSFAMLTAGTSILNISDGFAAGNLGVFTVTAVAATYFEITNAAGVVESNVVGPTIIDVQPLINGTTCKVAWRITEIYIYDGQASAAHSLTVTLLVSKL
jgi:hypothetical protein